MEVEWHAEHPPRFELLGQGMVDDAERDDADEMDLFLRSTVDQVHQYSDLGHLEVRKNEAASVLNQIRNMRAQCCKHDCVTVDGSSL